MRKTIISCLLTLGIFLSISYSVENTEKDQKNENLRTFAKLYGYVRFFHPSDKANAIDWDRFAIHGVQHLKDAHSRAELKRKLEDLFYPIAPTVQIYPTDKKPPNPSSLLIPNDTTDLKLVAWQHRGYGFGKIDTYKSVRLNRPFDDPAEPLFTDHPEAGEVVEKNLGQGLSAQIPLALFSKEEQTLRPDHAPSVNPLKDSLQSVSVDTLTGANQSLRYADVIIAWNIFQHFYPYFDIVDVNWDHVLTESLQKASNDQTPEGFLKTLKWMIVQLKDGHGGARLPQKGKQYKRLPFIINEAEGKIVISSVSISANKNDCFKQGDIITSINGKPTDQWLKNKRKFISGSPQWKTASALRSLMYDPSGEEVILGLKGPEKSVTCKVIYDEELDFKVEDPKQIEEIQNNIYYVNLDKAPMEEINKKLNTLATAKGIIFDLRGRPNRNDGVLGYLSKDTLRSAHFMIPQFIYPNQRKTTYDSSGRWIRPPREPYFSGKNVFLTNKHAISYSESVMGIVEHYELAEITGEATAGANGNMNIAGLPGGYKIRWTGMKVVKHDSSQHHLVGIKPTVPVEPTVEGIRQGRDVYIEKALEVINASTSR